MDSQRLDDSRDQIWGSSQSSQEDEPQNDKEIQCDLDMEELAYRKKKADEMKAALVEAKHAQKVAEEKWQHREHVDSLAAKYRKEQWDAHNQKMESLVNERNCLRDENAALKKQVDMLDKARKELSMEKAKAIKVSDTREVELTKAKQELRSLQREVARQENSKSANDQASTSNMTVSKLVDKKPNYGEYAMHIVHWMRVLHSLFSIAAYVGSPKKDPRPLKERYSKDDWEDYIRRRREAIAKPSADAEFKAWKLGGKNWRSHISRFIKVPLPENKLPLPENYQKNSDKKE